jgi:GNAT superfamily N-acetyltransferase
MSRATPSVAVRRAAIDDLEALLRLVSGYRAFYKQAVDPARERAFIEAHLRAGTSLVLVAETEGAILGFAQIFPSYSTVHLAPSLILEDLFVVPEARGGGVAAILLEAALAHARDVGAYGMFLETAIDNHVAQRVYVRAGWRREGQLLKYNAPL